MTLPITIGENSASEPVAIDLKGLPHLFLSYCSEAGVHSFYDAMVAGLTERGRGAAVQFAVAFTRRSPSFAVGDGLRFPWVYIRGDEYRSTTASREAFLVALSRELQRRWKLQARGLGKDGRPSCPHLVILLDDVMDLVIASKKSVGLTFLQLLLTGHRLNMHVVAASAASCRHLLRQLMQVNPAIRDKFGKLFEKHPFPLATPLGAELVLTAEDFVFFKEAGAVEYSRYYPLYKEGVEEEESCQDNGR